jgi:hypothetical protein
MANNIARLLKTDVMADFDLKGLAQILQSRGRRGDSILAHITPEEAEMLREEGGSGTINPETGLPEFYDDAVFNMETGAEMSPQEVAAANPDLYPGGELPAEGQTTTFQPMPAIQPIESFGKLPTTDISSKLPTSYPQVTIPEGPVSTAFFPGAGGQLYEMPPAKEPGVLDQLQSAWQGMTPQQKNLLLRAGLGVGMGGLTALQGRQAAKQARAAERKIADIGAPYQQQGQEQMAMARRGELTAGSQQQIEAARAALAQGVQRRGGIGAQQAATQLQAFRQQLLDNQYNYGLKIAQVGDQYAQRAIQTGLTQDKDIAALMTGLTAALGGSAGAQPTKRD